MLVIVIENPKMRRFLIPVGRKEKKAEIDMKREDNSLVLPSISHDHEEAILANIDEISTSRNTKSKSGCLETDTGTTAQNNSNQSKHIADSSIAIGPLLHTTFIYTHIHFSGTDADGNKTRRRNFRIEWKEMYPWLQLKEEGGNQVVKCSICTEAVDCKVLLPTDSRSLNTKQAFVVDGFHSWSHALNSFKKHETSRFHMDSAKGLHSMKHAKSVVSHLSAAKQKEMKEARVALFKIFDTIRFIAKEGLPFRGDYKTDENFEDSKFMQLLKMRATDVPELKAWLQRTQYKWLHHSNIEEILKLLAESVLNTILVEIRESKYFSVMMDETADISRMEQVSFCIRYVNDQLDIKEQFIGFYETNNTRSETLYNIFKDILIRCQLDIENIRGQCFDGAANVKGEISGLQSRIKEINPAAMFVHCVAHRLNLVVQDAFTGCSYINNFLGIVKQMISFIRDSPKRLSCFKDFQTAEASTLTKYCPTRWCIRIKSLKSIRDNYTALSEFFYETSEDNKLLATITANAATFYNKLDTFEFYFYLIILIHIFERVETLNQALQKKRLMFK